MTTGIQPFPTRAGEPARCVRCGETFHCGRHAGSCWCGGLPALDPLPAGLAASCLCERCLRSALAESSSARATAAPGRC